ncbi:MAG: Flp family type IVb pilin [Microthrixaceae bacterium]
MLTNFEFISAYLQAKVRSERAASLVEYALLVALIAVVCIAAVTTLGNRASSNFSSISSKI